MRRLFALLISTIILGAQAPSDMSFYAVTYVEVLPASKAAAVTAFKQYRDASRKEDGFVRFEILEQVGRPGHFNIIETWTSQNALNAHAAAAHTKDWRAKFDSIRVSDYDQRPYKPLSVAPQTTTANDRAMYVVAHVDIGGQATNAPDLLRRLAETSRKEEGNLRFDVMQHAMRANHFTVSEVWRDQRALDTHLTSAHTRQYRETLSPITGSPIDERLYKAVD
jgi:autoinducer 2-degrading protein